jgi:hypothetical protein
MGAGAICLNSAYRSNFQVSPVIGINVKNSAQFIPKLTNISTSNAFASSLAADGPFEVTTLS